MEGHLRFSRCAFGWLLVFGGAAMHMAAGAVVPLLCKQSKKHEPLTYECFLWAAYHSCRLPASTERLQGNTLRDGQMTSLHGLKC